MHPGVHISQSEQLSFGICKEQFPVLFLRPNRSGLFVCESVDVIPLKYEQYHFRAWLSLLSSLWDPYDSLNLP